MSSKMSGITSESLQLNSGSENGLSINKLGSIALSNRALIFYVLLLAIALRLFGINFGLPHRYDVDEDNFVEPTMWMLGALDFDPRSWQHPGSTTIYLLALSFTAVFAIGMVTGKFKNPKDFLLLFQQDPGLAYLTGRLDMAFFGVANVLMVYLIGRKLFNAKVGLLASFLLAIAPLHVGLSQIIRTDTELSFAILVAFWFTLKIMETQSRRSYLLAGFVTGVAFTTKYNGVFFALTIIVVHFLTLSQNEYFKFKRHINLILAGIAAFVGLVITSPFLLFRIPEIMTALGWEARLGQLAGSSEGLFKNIIWYLTTPFVSNFTIIGLVLLIFGFIALLLSKQKKIYPLLFFVVSYLIFISSLTLRWDRWIAPLMPFVALIIAYGLSKLVTFIQTRSNMKYAMSLGTVAFVLMIVPPLQTTLMNGGAKAGEDTRTITGDWILKNIPKGSNILLEQSTSELPKDFCTCYDINQPGEMVPADSVYVTTKQIGNLGRLADLGEVKSHSVQYFVTNMWYYESYLAEASTYPEAIKNYEQIFASGELLYEIEPIDGMRNGPKIRVYRLISYPTPKT